MLTRKEVEERESVYIKRVEGTTQCWREDGKMDFLDGSTIQVNSIIRLNEEDISVEGWWVGYDCLFRDEEHYTESKIKESPSLEEELQSDITTGVNKLEAGKSYRCIDKEGFIGASDANNNYARWFTNDIATIDDVDVRGNGYSGEPCVIAYDEYQFFEEVVGKVPEILKEFYFKIKDSVRGITYKYLPKEEVVSWWDDNCHSWGHSTQGAEDNVEKGEWILCDDTDYEKCKYLPRETTTSQDNSPLAATVKDNKPIKSDGGKSSYYEIILPEWLLQKQSDQGFIMIEDLAEVLYNNEFNYTNVLKTQKRMYELEQGKGKEGNSIEYDANKGKYSIDKQVERFNREK